MGADSISVVVSAPDGLEAEDVAKIKDIVIAASREVDTTINYLFVSVQTNKTFVCRNINVFLFFQFTCQIIDSFLKCIA